MKQLILLALFAASTALAFNVESFSTMGKQTTILESHEEEELYFKEGKGVLNHMFFAGGIQGIQDTRIRVYVDGEEEPSIDMTLAKGFCNGYGSGDFFNTTSIVGKNGRKAGYYNTIKIPFGKSIRITGQNDKDMDIWWNFRGTENIPLVIDGIKLPKKARLKLHKVDELRVEPYEEFDMLNSEKDGMLYMVYMEGDGLEDSYEKPVAKGWYKLSFLEACVRAYTGGSEEATYLSSGLEDYFLGTFYFNTGRYANDLAGLTHFDKKNNKFAAYRIHERDPFFYKDGLRLTCKSGEILPETGEKLHDSPATIYTTYVWYYEW